MRSFFKTLLGIENVAKASPLPISTPDITHGQVFAFGQFAVSSAVSAAVLSPAEGQVLIGASGLLGLGIAIGDAVIRLGRSHAIGAKILASVQGKTGKAGVNTPAGDPLPPAPTSTQSKPIDRPGANVGDGTGTEPPAEVKSALAYKEAVEPPPPPPPPPPPTPTPQQIASAEVAVRNAQDALSAAMAKVDQLRRQSQSAGQ